MQLILSRYKEFCIFALNEYSQLYDDSIYNNKKMRPIYYKYHFEDEPTDNKYQIRIKYKDMAIKDNRLIFIETDKETITSRAIDHFFLDTMTHYSLIELDDYLDFHFKNFEGEKEDYLLHTERILKKGISLMELKDEEWKKKDPTKDVMRSGDNPKKYLVYHRHALDWIDEMKRNYSIYDGKYQSEILRISKILRNYQKSFECYLSAVDKLENNHFERNILDDLRLTLELFIKAILNNNKSLENQREQLGSYCKNKGISKEIYNMFDKLIDFFSKYQNNYIKHDNEVNKNEVLFIFNLTNTFINFLND